MLCCLIDFATRFALSITEVASSPSMSMSIQTLHFIKDLSSQGLGSRLHSCGVVRLSLTESHHRPKESFFDPVIR